LANQKHIRIEVASAFPHAVYLPPREGGWGKTLDAMGAWCGEHIGVEHWRSLGGFHFARESDALAFREAWKQEIGTEVYVPPPWPMRKASRSTVRKR
jgi:hypothetical protein